MSWLSKLATIGEIAGLVAAPFTGGGSLALTAASKGAKIADAASKVGKIAGAVNTVGKVAGNTSKARADARVAETGLNAQQDNAAINRAVVDTNLTQSKQGNAVQNALREGVKDFSITRPSGVPSGRSTGGYRPSAITGVNDLGKQFKEQDLASLMAGTPKLTPAPQAGKFDKFLNIAGGIAGLAGLAGQAKSAFSGASSVPQINTTANVATDPMAFIKDLPTVNTAVAPPPQSTYRPRFTGRY